MLSSRVLGPTRDEGMTELEVYARWLRSLPHHGRYRALSPHRSYDTPEEAYDRDSAPNLFAGELLTGMLDEVAPGLSGICLEIGCGTGYLTCGLAAAGRFERYLVTDASERFLDITRMKLERLRVERVDFAVFDGADVGEIAFDRFALIAARSVLHHIPDYRGFFAALARRLRPGGVIAMLEPRAEFFLMTATLLGLLPALAEGRGTPLSEAELGHVRLFDAATRFYLDRTSDKTGAEDRYVFTTEELAALASENGLSFHRMGAEKKTRYSDDLLSYLAGSMSFPEGFVAKVKDLLGGAARGIDKALRDLAPINASEWLLFRKEARS
jgi:SAM-dependent methyltransferase